MIVNLLSILSRGLKIYGSSCEYDRFFILTEFNKCTNFFYRSEYHFPDSLDNLRRIFGMKTLRRRGVATSVCENLPGEAGKHDAISRYWKLFPRRSRRCRRFQLSHQSSNAKGTRSRP